MGRLAASLAYFRRTNLAVVAGAAVATAVLTGALVVGDSVRGSLRELTLARLGRIDQALVAERLFGQRLADDLEARLAGAEVAPVLLLRGAATAAESGARASQVAILGVDERFTALYDAPPLDFERRAGQIFPSVVLNRSLAVELGVEPGGEVVLSFRRQSELPEETLVGRRRGGEAIETLRLAVSAVVPDRGLGGFSLAAEQMRPANAFVELGRLERALDARGRVNGLLVAGVEPDDRRGEEPAATDERLATALAEAVTAADLGVVLREGEAQVTVESREFVLADELATAALAAVDELGGGALPVATYLANRIEAGGRSVPYSTIAALDPPPLPALGRLTLVSGEPAPALGDDEILLDRWAAEDLGYPGALAPGDPVAVTYYELGPRDELTTAVARFRLAGVVELEGLAIDETLTPEFPGMSDADDMSSWDPPFPVELAAIGGRDEEYWDLYRAAPKAFVAAALGRRLWASRFGELTSVRLAVPGASGAELADRLAAALPRRLDPAALGLAWRPVRRQGLAAAEGATDFAQLFLGFSMFLIASAALLVGLLFRLGVEQRAGEVGLLRAVGFPLARVRRHMLAEGGVLAALGALAGLAGAAGYAWLMLAGLRSWWLPAVGAPVLFLHLEPVTLALGWAISVAVVLAAIWWGLRRLVRQPPPALLAGAVAAGGAGGRSRRARPIAQAAGAAGLALVVWMVATGSGHQPGLAFGAGAALLVAGVAAFAHWSQPSERRANALTGGRTGGSGLTAMGARNSARNPGRSLVSVALVASAAFLIVAVEAFRGGTAADPTDRSSGTGGFTLMAESEVPLTVDLGRSERRADLGFSPAASAALDGAEIYPFRLLPGEDASCLNLYRPQQPRVLGVPPEMIERGGFTLRTGEETDAPWRLLTRDLGPGVVPAFADANSAQWILKAGLGDEVTVAADNGEPLRLRLVGLVAKSIFQSELLIAEEAFLRYFPNRAGYQVFLVEVPPEAVGEAAGALESSLGRFGFDAVGTAERLAAFQAVENTYLSTFQALGGLGLLLGTVGLGIVMLRNVLERRGELATMRAFGFRRRRLSLLVVAENAFLLAVGIAVGTVSALVAVAPHALATGARVPWGALAATLATVLAVGLAASIAAVRGALATPLLPALKAE